MAQIDIQKKEGPPTWVWIVGVIALLVVVGVVWAVMANNNDRDDTRMHQDTVPAAQRGTTPTSGLDPAADMGTYVVFSEHPGRVGAVEVQA
jgi:hypothetical protein